MKKLINGKVRDVYEISYDKLVIVTTDRISAFDVVLPKIIPGKGKILNTVSLFWFDFTKDIIPNHIISSDFKALPEFFQKKEFEERTILVKKLKILPFEFIIRGYMFGSMWGAYLKTHKFCGYEFDEVHNLYDKLPVPLFTPSTKAHTGHDEYVSVKQVENTLGKELTDKIKNICLKLYAKCYDYAYSKEIIIADTKFEFGLDENNELILADEILTPDSSRFWEVYKYTAEKHKKGTMFESFDKQILRNWLINNKKDGKMQFDNVPNNILQKTYDVYSNYFKKIV